MLTGFCFRVKRNIVVDQRTEEGVSAVKIAAESPTRHMRRPTAKRRFVFSTLSHRGGYFQVLHTHAGFSVSPICRLVVRVFTS